MCLEIITVNNPFNTKTLKYKKGTNRTLSEQNPKDKGLIYE